MGSNIQAQNHSSQIEENGKAKSKRSHEYASLLMPLNEAEVETIMKSWSHIRKEMAQTGTRMFLRFFASNAEIKGVFSKFQGLDLSLDPKGLEILEAHGMVVMNSLDEILNNLDDVQRAIDIIFEKGVMHVKMNLGIRPDIFLSIRQPFLDSVRETLGRSFTPALHNLYTRFITFVLETFISGFKKGLSLQNSNGDTVDNKQ